MKTVSVNASTETDGEIVHDVSTETDVEVGRDASTETDVDAGHDASTESDIEIGHQASTDTDVKVWHHVSTETDVEVARDASTETEVGRDVSKPVFTKTEVETETTDQGGEASEVVNEMTEAITATFPFDEIAEADNFDQTLKEAALYKSIVSIILTTMSLHIV